MRWHKVRSSVTAKAVCHVIWVVTLFWFVRHLGCHVTFNSLHVIWVVTLFWIACHLGCHAILDCMSFGLSHLGCHAILFCMPFGLSRHFSRYYTYRRLQLYLLRLSCPFGTNQKCACTTFEMSTTTTKTTTTATTMMTTTTTTTTTNGKYLVGSCFVEHIPESKSLIPCTSDYSLTIRWYGLWSKNKMLAHDLNSPYGYHPSLWC